MDKKKLKNSIIKYTVILFCGAVIVFLLYIALKNIMPGFLEVLRNGDEEEIQEFIRGSGSVKGAALTFVLQFMQVVSIVFTGVPIQIAAGVVFGAFKGYLICHAGYVSANAAVFSVRRKLGGKFDEWFDTGKKASKGRFIKETDSPAFMVFLCCLIPMLPNGIIPYMAAKTDITLKKFLIAVTAGSFPTILVLCSVGNKILKGDFLEAGILCALLVIVIVTLYIKRNAVTKWGIEQKNKIKEKFNIHMK